MLTMSHRNQLMNPGQEMLDDNIEYATERRFSVAYEIRPSHPPSHDFSPPPTPSKRRNVASREFASSTPKLWTRWSYINVAARKQNANKRRSVGARSFTLLSSEEARAVRILSTCCTGSVRRNNLYRILSASVEILNDTKFAGQN